MGEVTFTSYRRIHTTWLNLSKFQCNEHCALHSYKSRKNHGNYEISMNFCHGFSWFNHVKTMKLT